MADEKWSEWIDYSGEGQPVPNGVMVEVTLFGGSVQETSPRPSENWCWEHIRGDFDIIAYRYLITDDNTMTEEEAELPAEEWVGKIGGPRKAESFLHQAAELLAERGKQYDQPGGERSMGKAVAALNAITGRDLTEAEGWLLMSLVKRVRQHSGQGYHKDSAEDAVAYAGLEAEALEAKG